MHVCTAAFLLFLLASALQVNSAAAQKSSLNSHNVAFVLVADGSERAETYQGVIAEMHRLADFTRLRLHTAIIDIGIMASDQGAVERIMRAIPPTAMIDGDVILGGHGTGSLRIQKLITLWPITRPESRLRIQVPGTTSDVADMAPRRPLGLVSLASGLSRRYRSQIKSLELATLTIAADQDASFRPFRLAEDVYADRLNGSVVMMRNTSSLFGDGATETALAMINYLMALSFSDQDAIGYLKAKTGAALAYLRPALTAMELESSLRLRPACYESPSSESSTQCWQGSRWTETAQVMAANLKEVRFSVQDGYAKRFTRQSAVIVNNCTHPDSTCLLNISTFSQSDLGRAPVGAIEIRAKMRSRQAVHAAAGINNPSFGDLDGGEDYCQQLNQRAIDWALLNADESVRQRYEIHGVRLVTGTDKVINAGGPFWVLSPLEWSKQTDANGRAVMVVRSKTLRTSLNFTIKPGNHYCKLLSPMRALEWIYFDAFMK